MGKDRRRNNWRMREIAAHELQKVLRRPYLTRSRCARCGQVLHGYARIQDDGSIMCGACLGKRVTVALPGKHRRKRR